MSFNDLERGEASAPLLRGLQTSGMSPACVSRGTSLMASDPDKAFTELKDSVSIQIFKIQSNVTGIQRLVDKVGSPNDGPALRTSLCVSLYAPFED